MVSKLFGEVGAGDALPGRDEDRVVARDGSRDVAERRGVEHAGERVRVARRRRDDEQVARRDEREREAPERGGQLAEAVEVPGARMRVDEPAVLVAHLDEPELRDVARHRRLHRLEAVVAQRLRDFGLRRELAGVDETEDRALPVELAHRTSSRIASPCSSSSAVNVSGGVSRSELSHAVPTSSPRSRQSATTSAAERGVSTASSSPRPRTLGSRDAIVAPCAITPASSSSSTVSHTATAAAHATGLPPKVLAWSPGTNAPAAASATSRHPIGSPFASPFARVTASGRTPSCSKAKNVPVRPTPVWTSSKTSSAPASSASVRAASTNLASSGMIPPSPSTGSSRMQPVSLVTAASSDATSFGLANATPGSSGSNAARFAGCPVTESAPHVRPWNEPSSATISVLPDALRAYFSAASIASAPELQKNACAPPKRWDSRSASCVIGSVQ